MRHVFCLVLCATDAAPTWPTRQDLAWAAATYADHRSVFAELCAQRWGLDEVACEARWRYWLDMRAREAARGREIVGGDEPPALYVGATAEVNHYEPLWLGRALEPSSRCGRPRPGPVLALGARRRRRRS